MPNIIVHRHTNQSANIAPLGPKRDWMGDTADNHAYQCFPITLTNQLGWGISFPEDIVFIWDGVYDTDPSHVKVLEGEKYAYSGRGNGTISFRTGLIFKTNEDVSTLIMPVPNEFNLHAHCFTAVISTSFFKGDLPIAWQIIEPNIEITIPAGTPVASAIPLSLGNLQQHEMNIFEGPMDQQYYKDLRDHAMEMHNIVVNEGRWSRHYRDAIGLGGKPEGNHETKSINLITNPIKKEDQNAKD
jgi:hypothetical protein